MKGKYFHDGCCPYSLFTRPSDASPVVFCMNEGPEYFRIRKLIEEGGGVLEKARKFDASGKRIRIHDRQMIALEKETDLFCLSYIEDCVKEDDLLPNLKDYRLGRSLFSDYDPFDILIGELTWKDLHRPGEIVSQLENMEPTKKKSFLSGASRPYSTADQVDILDFIIKHKKFNALRDIQTWRSMVNSGLCSGARSENSLRDHFRKQILPKIHVKTFPQFSEEDLNKVIQGWKQKQDYYAPPPLEIKVVEKASPKHRVNFKLPEGKDKVGKGVVRRSSPRIGVMASEKTRIDESIEQEEETPKGDSPSNKRRRLSRPESPHSSPSSYSMPSSLKASQIFSNEILEAGTSAAPSQEASQPKATSSIQNYFDTFPPELMEFLEKGSQALMKEDATSSQGKTVSHAERKTMTVVNNYEVRQSRTEVQEDDSQEEEEEEIISGALSKTDPLRKRGENGSPVNTRVSQSLDLHFSSQTHFSPLGQSTQKEPEEAPKKSTRIQDFFAPVRNRHNKGQTSARRLSRKQCPSKDDSDLSSDDEDELNQRGQAFKSRTRVLEDSSDSELENGNASHVQEVKLEEYDKSLENCLQTKIAKVTLQRLSSVELAKFVMECPSSRRSSSSGKEEEEQQEKMDNVESIAVRSTPAPPKTQRKAKSRKRPPGRPRKRQLYCSKTQAVPQIFTPLDRETASRVTVEVAPPEPPPIMEEDQSSEDEEMLLPKEGEEDAQVSSHQRSSSRTELDKANPSISATTTELVNLDDVMPEESKESSEVSLKNTPYSEQEDKVLMDLLDKGRISGSDLKNLYKSKSLPGRSMQSIKNRVDEIKCTLRKSKKKKRDRSVFTDSDDMKIINWIIKRHCFGALTGKVIWQIMEREKVLRRKSADSLQERFKSHIIPNISSYKLDKNLETKFLFAFEN